MDGRAISNTQKFYIDGRWVDPAAPVMIDVVDPATEEVFARVPGGNATDVDRAVSAARRAFETFSLTTRAERLALLARIVECYERRADEIAGTLSREIGVPISYARAMQVPIAVQHLRAMIKILETYEFEHRDGSMMVVREPIGVCALITPWNWPLNQIACKVGPAIAAGCTIVLKPSEVSPFSALLFAQVMHEAGVPAGVFNLVNGTGESVGAALSSHPQVDMVSITGSTRAGVLVAQSAAATAKRVTQELGGKSPNILLPDAEFTTAVARGVAACFRNSGQSCSAPTRMIVPADRLAEIEALAKAAADAFVVGPPGDEATQLGPVANVNQFTKIQSMIEIGMAEGAKLVAGGPGRPAHLTRGFFVRPTVFSNVTPQMTIAREEIFGPVLAIQPYRDEDEAIAIANDTVYGLSSCVQSRDTAHARCVAARIRAGQVHINYPDWSPFAAFGGYKQSGNGREYGVAGFEEYLETKTLLGYAGA
ncbi:MAG: aldehyde dehydrogenase family protein [Usitatibacter sp.]